jgi:hypothetical protein
MDNNDYNITGLTHVVRIHQDSNKTVLKLLLQESVVSSVEIKSKTEKGFRQALQELAIKGGINNLVRISILNNIAKKIYLASWNIKDNTKISSQTTSTNLPNVFTQKVDKILEIVRRNETRFTNIEDRIQKIEKKITGTTSLIEQVPSLEKLEIRESTGLTKSTETSEKVLESEDDLIIKEKKEIEKIKIVEEQSKPIIDSNTDLIDELDSTLLSEQEEISESESDAQIETNEFESESSKEIDRTSEQNVLIEDSEEQSILPKDLIEDYQEIKIKAESSELGTETDKSESESELKSESEQITEQITESESITAKNDSKSISELEKEDENQVNDQGESNESTNIEEKIENNEDEEF